jgi:Xaa-Pro aminopeptidase
MNRIEKIQKELPGYNVEALYISSPLDIFYCTGLTLSKGTLLIFPDACCLIVDGRYFEACKASATIPVYLDKAVTLSTLLGKTHKIGFDGDFETVNACRKLHESIPQLSWVPISKPCGKARLVKEPEEIEKIEKACRLCQEGFDFLLTQIHEGVTEEELARALEIFWIQKGGTLAFESIIAFGKNSAFPHARAGKTALCRNETIVVDIGVKRDGYNSDMTRNVFFGTVHPEIEKIAQIVLEAQEEAFLSAVPGISAFELDGVARAVIEEEGYGQYYTHNLGHGVGLEVHEDPYLKHDPAYRNTLLAQGMVITIEPGIYLPGIGGVRIEDTCVIEEKGARSLFSTAKKPIKIG